jgi:hypothetical protein
MFRLTLLAAVAAAAIVFPRGLRAEDLKKPAKSKEPEGLVRLSPKFPVWIDGKNKRVVMVGRICLREGQMEMFACLRRTKEHESIVAVPTEAYIVHAGLVASGAEPGNPARFVPKYEPARGTEIAITLYWSDEKGGRHKARAQEWLHNLRTNKAMEQPWVFGGSGFWVDPLNGQRHYQAEDGDFICVSNFASAMLDVPVESTASNTALLFEAATDKIPPMHTQVTLVLTPQLKDLPAERGDDPKTDLIPLPADEDPKPGE